ncbi:hypothetical protein BC833DRAFT_577313 [Globomyces pollinis-pini]|nr:hypothetical protein BC833DRAFT_577313 [Globomyces pollinis-pini]
MQHPGSSNHIEQSHFESAFAASSTPNWAMEFQSQQMPMIDDHPHLQQNFEDAFEQAKESLAWEAEFNQNTTNWAGEFEQQQNTVAVDDKDALAKTAGILAGIVSSSANPKFKSSQFLSMMEQLRDKEIAIEGDKVVQQIQPATSFANEFLKENGNSLANEFTTEFIKGNQNNFTNEFLEQEGTSSNTTQMMPPLPDSRSLAQQFLGNNGQSLNWEEQFNMQSVDYHQSVVSDQERVKESHRDQSPPRNWAQEFKNVEQTAESKDSLDWAHQFAGDVSHDMDWALQFRNQGMEGASNDWEKIFDNKLTENDTLAANTFNATNEDPRIRNYPFTQNNVYNSYTMEQLLSPDLQSNLTESILAYEAVVQKDPSNSNAWLELGKRQQENENDFAAIAALRKAIESNPNQIDAYLTIAVSYSNENFSNEAYQSLNDWLNHNAKYSHIPSTFTQISSTMERHDVLVQRYLQAAISQPGHNFDPDVQSALGILFNIGMEYNKAVDCFQAALSTAPGDFQLWNRLGATLANSGESEKAIDAYFNALQINPSYIRARYNLAIASMQMGQYQEAAGYLLGALAIQERNIEHVSKKNSDNLQSMHSIHLDQSEGVWNALRMLMSSYLRRDDLSNACDARDLNSFRGEFDF